MDSSHTALIIVDVQNDFCHIDGSLGKQGLDVSMVDDMMPSLHGLIEHAKAQHLPIIYVQTIHEDCTDSETWSHRLKGINERNVCRKNTWGAGFYKISPEANDIVVIKHRYSAFINTRLDSILRSMKIDTLIMTGVSTNVCVESTARDGFMLDYQIIFLSDCTAAYSREEHDMTLSNIHQYFGEVADSNKVISMLNLEKTT